MQSRASMSAALATGDGDGAGAPGPRNGTRSPLPPRVPVRAAPDAQAATPDLLHPDALVTVDQAGLRRSLEFAFTAGDAAGAAGAALRRAGVVESSFRPESFAADLFIDDFIADCLHFHCEGQPARIDTDHLKRLLCQPPSDPEVARFRNAVLAELSGSEPLQRGFEQGYAAIVELIRLFDESGGHSRLDLPRWRLDLLRALRVVIERFDGPFASASSGIARLDAFAKLVRGSRGYAELCALLDFEADTTRVKLALQLGVDGRIRTLDVMEASERPVEPFYRSPMMRLGYRILMWLRGYRMGEGELVERYFDHVYLGLLDYLPALLQLRGDLEFYLAAMHLRRRAQARGLAMSLPTIGTQVPRGEAGHRRVQGLWNPLLLGAEQPPVPCGLDVDALERTCIVTGPNSGGKTRLLQSLAYVQLLGQAGFFVPAELAHLRFAPSLFVSLGHESSADQREGRLGTELMRIRSLFESALPGSLVIIDELCSGTNPSEGIEIFQLVLELLQELRPEAYITTHFLQFAETLSGRPDDCQLCFLQVELDERSCPTYQFVPGVAQTSLASRTAARLGVTRDELLGLIKRSRART